MQIELIATGRSKSGPQKDLFDDYAGRIRRIGPGLGIPDFSLREFPEGRGGDTRTRQRQEADAVLAAIDPSHRVMLLDERGSSLTSDQLARRIAEERDSGTRVLTCIIGGPDGVDGSLRDRADFTLSLGRLTWPHLLARALLAEQVYRSLTIIGRHPYHRA